MTDALLLQSTLARQHGVATWAQLLAGGWTREAMRKAARHNELVRVHPRVYVTHNGPLTWPQRAWAAVLWAEPAALCWDSATLHPIDSGPIHVAISRSRYLHAPEGISVHRVVDLEAMRRRGTAPPRLRLEHNALCRAGAARSDLDAIALITEALAGPVTPREMRTALDLHPRLPRRALVRDVIEDAAAGTCSVLEHGYLTRVERPHGLPIGARQAPRIVDGRLQYRDVEYVEFDFVVELDSVWHDGFAAKDRDADRDLDDLVARKASARLRWGQVFGRPCRTAERIGSILSDRGWAGRPHRCGPACTIG